jgi:hypothetical protein
MSLYVPSANGDPVGFSVNLSQAPSKIQPYCGGLVAHFFSTAGCASGSIAPFDAAPLDDIGLNAVDDGTTP